MRAAWVIVAAVGVLLATAVGGAAAQARYRVRSGDTLIGIARRFDVKLAALKRANRLRGNLIRPGMRLRIPGHDGGRGARPPELSEEQKRALERAEALGLGTSRVAHHLLLEPPEDRWVDAAGEADERGDLLLPVEGGVYLRGWGSGRRGYHLAVDIGASRGAPVRAAASGIVAYAGNGVRGYGNIVIVVHPREWVTWYTHHHQNLVVAGQRVERGETLGTVGDTGYARGTHLHFMWMIGGEHCDPLPLIRPGVERPDGQPMETERIRWTDGRPEGLRCRPKRSRSRRRHRRRRR